MLRSRIRRTAASAAVLALLGTVTACGGDEEAPGATTAAGSEGGSSEAASAGGDAEGPTSGGYDEDLPDPGDDLLSGSRWGGTFAGATHQASWRFPATYESEMSDSGMSDLATLVDNGTAYKIQIGAGTGDAEDMRQGAEQARGEAEAAGQTVALHEVAIGDMEATVLTQEGGTESARTFFHAPGGGSMFYVVNFVAGEHLDETPQQRLDELHQTVASLEFE